MNGGSRQGSLRRRLTWAAGLYLGGVSAVALVSVVLHALLH